MCADSFAFPSGSEKPIKTLFHKITMKTGEKNLFREKASESILFFAD
jgi:hypothetical protein